MFPATDRNSAISGITQIAQSNQRANHNCYAFIIGSPSQPSEKGSSDDGEPSGTAGRPMLSVLEQQGIGDVAVVVTRYFGGIKLGTGGLVRAYMRGVQQALSEAELTEKAPSSILSLTFDYQFQPVVKANVESLGGTVTDSSFTDRVDCTIAVPTDQMETVKERLQEITAGSIIIRP